MAFLCPHCDGKVERRTNPMAGMFGLIGLLFTIGSGKYHCKECGEIPKREFSPEVRSQMTRNAAINVVVVFVLLVGVIALLIYLTANQ